MSPGARLAEQHSMWHAAHKALDLPEAGAEEGDMTTGALRTRVRAYQRQEVWGPRYVADELEDAHRAAQDARTDAELWEARAAAATDPDKVAQLRAASDQARAKAAEAEHDAELLEAEDAARAEFYVHTATSRELAERSRAELESRGLDIDDPEKQVATDEWLELERETRVEDDVDRAITEEDLAVDGEDVDFLGEVDAPEVTGHDTEQPAAAPDDMRANVAKAQAALARVRAEAEQNHEVDTTEPADDDWVDDEVTNRDDALLLQ